MKEKTKKILQITILLALIICGLIMMGIRNSVTAASSLSRTLFYEDIGTSLNWDTIPTNIFSDSGISLWCMDKGHSITKYMTASQVYDEAYEADETIEGENVSYEDLTQWDWESVQSGHVVDNGMIYDVNDYKVIRKMYAHYTNIVADHYWKNQYGSKYYIGASMWFNGTSVKVTTPYEGDSDELLMFIQGSGYGLPGVWQVPYVESLTYEGGQNLTSLAALYVLTAPPTYSGAVPESAESLSDEQKAEGAFTVVEKQYALWELEINIGNRISTDNDRNLGNIAQEYEEFYEGLHAGGSENPYEDIIDVSNGYDDEGNIDKSHIEEKTEEIDGEECKTYVFEKTIVEIDTQKECYVLGPFMIDYTVDDENKDTYYTTDGYEVKFNAIQRVKVYNQDKVDIEELGGSFKLAYSYGGSSIDEAKITRINNATYVTEDTILDGEEISGIESLEEFYIIIYRGDMKPEDFKGFFAKIDFEYLESVDGVLQQFDPTVNKYYYTETKEPYSYTYTVTYNTTETYKETVVTGTDEDGNEITEEQTKTKTVSHTGYLTVNTSQFSYDLQKEETGESGQTQLGYYNESGWRNYKKFSIIITSDWDDVDVPEIEIDKVCKTDGEALYGAEFNITLEIEGVDIFDNEISESLSFSRITDKDGRAVITSEDITQAGVYLGGFTGKIVVRATEVAAPANHATVTTTYTMSLVIKNRDYPRFCGGFRWYSNA